MRRLLLMLIFVVGFNGIAAVTMIGGAYVVLWAARLCNQAWVLELSDMPMGIAFLVFTLPSWLAFCRWLRRLQPRTPQTCESCGYDLRATPPGGRCPECGTVTDVNSTTVA